MMRGVLPLGVAFALWLAAAGACAQATDPAPPSSDAAGDEAEARASFDAGRVALEQGRPEEALLDFREAYRLSARPELLYNIGLVEDRLRHDRAALDAFRGYLDAVPEATNRASVEDRIHILEEEIARDDALSRALAQTSTPGDDRGSGDDLLTSPVLWVIVGVVVVGAGVGIGLGVGLGQDPGTAPATPGPSGVVVSALTF